MRKSDRIPVGPQYDRRRKLSDAQKAEILRIYQAGVCGMRPLAKQFGVSRSTIQIIVNPERAAQVKQRVKEHWRDYRPSKKEWAAIMREHRQYKHDLYVQGKLKEEMIMLKFVKLMAKTNEVEAEVYAAINLEYSSLFYLEDEHKNYVYEIAASKGYGAYEGVVYTSYILIGDNLEPTIMILASGEIANEITSDILEIERLYEDEDGVWVVLYPTRGFNSISMEFDFIEPEEIPSYI